MLTHLKSLGTYWIFAYLTLIAIYIGLGFTIHYLNRILGESKRIQQRNSDPKMIRRDFTKSIKSLGTISGFWAGGLYLRSLGFGWMPFGESWLYQVSTVLLSMIIFDTWFYWGHRLMHLKPIYRYVHKWHHKAVTPTVWSNNSDTFLDNCVVQSYWLVAPFICPISFWGLVFHKIYDQVTGIIGHSGFEYSPGKMSCFPSPLVGVTFHDQHHERFNVNFGTHFSLWDRVMGTLAKDYDKTVAGFTQ